jgi:hypothetical protein
MQFRLKESVFVSFGILTDIWSECKQGRDVKEGLTDMTDRLCPELVACGRYICKQLMYKQEASF